MTKDKYKEISGEGGTTDCMRESTCAGGCLLNLLSVCFECITIAKKAEPVTTQMYTKTKMILNIASAASWIKI